MAMQDEQVIDSAEKYFAEMLKPQYDEFFDNPATLRNAFNLATALLGAWLDAATKPRLRKFFAPRSRTNPSLTVERALDAPSAAVGLC
jgi:hypothetical protein